MMEHLHVGSLNYLYHWFFFLILPWWEADPICESAFLIYLSPFLLSNIFIHDTDGGLGAPSADVQVALGSVVWSDSRLGKPLSLLW